MTRTFTGVSPSGTSVIHSLPPERMERRSHCFKSDELVTSAVWAIPCRSVIVTRHERAPIAKVKIAYLLFVRRAALKELKGSRDIAAQRIPLTLTDYEQLI